MGLLWPWMCANWVLFPKQTHWWHDDQLGNIVEFDEGEREADSHSRERERERVGKWCLVDVMKIGKRPYVLLPLA